MKKSWVKVYVILFVLWIYFARYFIDTLAWFPSYANWVDELLCIVGWGLVLLDKIERSRPRSLLGRSVVYFTVIVLVSNLVASNSLMFPLRYIVSFLKTVPVFYVIVRSELSLVEVKRLGGVWIASCLAQIPMVFFQQRMFFFVGEVGDFDWGQGFLGTNAAHDVAELMVVLILYYFALMIRGVRAKRNMLVILACLLALYLTFANHSYPEMAVILVLLIPDFTTLKINPRKLIRYGLGVMVGIGVVFWISIVTDAQIIERYLWLPEFDQIGKIQVILELQNLLSGVRSILLGLGPATFSSSVALDMKLGVYYNQITAGLLELAGEKGGSILDIPFSTGISVVAETGILGLIAFVAMYAKGVVFIRKHREDYREDNVIHAFYIAFNSLVIIYVFLFFLTNFAENPILTLPFWLLLGCLVRCSDLMNSGVPEN